MITGLALSRLEKAVDIADGTGTVRVGSDDLRSLIRSYWLMLERDQKNDELRSALRLIKETMDG